MVVRQCFAAFCASNRRASTSSTPTGAGIMPYAFGILRRFRRLNWAFYGHHARRQRRCIGFCLCSWQDVLRLRRRFCVAMIGRIVGQRRSALGASNGGACAPSTTFRTSVVPNPSCILGRFGRGRSGWVRCWVNSWVGGGIARWLCALDAFDGCITGCVAIVFASSESKKEGNDCQSCKMVEMSH